MSICIRDYVWFRARYYTRRSTHRNRRCW